MMPTRLRSPQRATCRTSRPHQNAAQTWAADNGLSPTDYNLSITGGSVTPKVTVDVHRSHSFSFIGYLGVGAKTVGAHAAAQKLSPVGMGGLMPWAITQDAIDQAPSGTLTTLHGDSQSPGNFGGFDIDGNGGSVYRDTIKYGSTGNACSNNQTNCTTAACPGTYPTTCAENSASCDGPECASEPGLKTGPTSQGLDYRFNLTSTACDSFSEVFSADTSYIAPRPGSDLYVSTSGGSSGGRLLSPGLKQPTNTPTPIPTHTNTPVPPTNTAVPPTSTPVPPTNTPAPTNTPGPTNTPAPTNTPGGPTSTPTVGPTSTPSAGGPKYKMAPNCNPWGAGACPNPDDGTTLCSRRVIVIPIIDAFGNGRKDATILGFALFFLESYNGGEVTGRFVKADVNMGALTGTYDPNSLVHSVKLTE